MTFPWQITTYVYDLCGAGDSSRISDLDIYQYDL